MAVQTMSPSQIRQTKQKEKSPVLHALEFLVSAGAHVFLVVILWSIPIATKENAKIVEVAGNVVEESTEKLDNLVTELKDEELSLDSPVNLLSQGSTGGGNLGAGSPLMNADALGSNAMEGLAVVSLQSPALNRPLASHGAGLELGGNVDGLVGGTVSGAGGAGVSDSGSVDRITVEILRQLEKKKVLVAWLMDSTESLAERREQIIKRFQRVYHELKTLEKDKNQALLTGVVSFGDRTTFMTPEPTADVEKLVKAVQAIKSDDSGKENVFAAITQTALKWRKYQQQQQRTLMIVVLTDEVGNDPGLLDDTVTLVKRNKIPVYVLGPMAPFGRKEVDFRWVDKETKESFDYKIERGPESILPEHLSLPYWKGGREYELFASGFGPYYLTRLARESGGLYFVYDDNLIRGPRFNAYDMLEYAPDYQAIREFKIAIAKIPLRAAVIRAAEVTREAARLQMPSNMKFRTGDNNAASAAQTIVANTMVFVEKVLPILREAEKYRAKEESKRWQAHFDLMMGRLLAAKVRCNEYNWHLAIIKQGTRPHAAGKNAWILVPDKDLTNIAFGKAPDQKKRATNVGKMEANANTKAVKDANDALAYLNRVVKEHKGTPWAVMAEAELDTPLAFKLDETFDEPPKPASPAEAAAAKAQAEEKQKKRMEAEKRKPKGL